MAKLIMARQDVDMDAKNATGRMAHSIAAESGNLDVAKLFLADPWVDENSRDEDGRMPLSLADEHGRDEVVKLLLDTGAVDVEDYHGRTALSWANKEDKKIVKALRGHAGGGSGRGTPSEHAENNSVRGTSEHAGGGSGGRGTPSEHRGGGSGGRGSQERPEPTPGPGGLLRNRGKRVKKWFSAVNMKLRRRLGISSGATGEPPSDNSHPGGL
jgi:hypothetical protein